VRDVVVRVAAVDDGALPVLLHQREHRQVHRHLVSGRLPIAGRYAGAVGGEHQIVVDVLARPDRDVDLVGHEARCRV
jgi:hypothetical protein